MFFSTVAALINVEHEMLDQRLIPVLVVRATERGDTEIVTRLKQIAGRSSEVTLQVLAPALLSEMRQKKPDAFKLASDGFLNLVENFKGFPNIGQDNFEVDSCLVQAVYLVPGKVLTWLEERVESEVNAKSSNAPST